MTLRRFNDPDSQVPFCPANLNHVECQSPGLEVRQGLIKIISMIEQKLELLRACRLVPA